MPARRLAAVSLSVVMCAAPAHAQNRTWINPLDIDYRYNFEQKNRGISYRTGADPVIVPHGDAYYLFLTIAEGYWRSTDLRDWTFVTPDRWTLAAIVAPAVRSVRDTLYLLQSMTTPRPLLYSTAPEAGRIGFFNRWFPPPPGAQSQWGGQVPGPDSIPPGPWDPDIFHDEDTGRWYLYWGSSNYYPLFGIELDRTRELLYVDSVVRLFRLHPERHGWERFGRDHRDPRDPFIEGAWMTKHGGRYYLQYGAPGTEYNVYANGVYVADAPLGPFTYAPYNPVAYRPGGFMTGAGHGNTFRDAHGNYWNTGTAWIGINWNFERRVVMYPAGFHDDQMYVNTRFGDFPHRVARDRRQDSDDLFAGWMLLSYRKHATASSVRDTFPAARVTDEDPRTYWLAADTADAWLAVDLGTERDVRAVQVNYADHASDIYMTDASVYTAFRLEHSRDGRTWLPLATVGADPQARRDRPNAYVELPQAVRTRHVRYLHGHVGAPNLAISDLRVFGNGDGAAPATPRRLRVRRDADARNALITWEPVAGAVGYNVLWGIAADRLYQTYQRFADEGTSLELRALTVGQDYWFAIEAFDENGVSAASAPVHVD